MIRLKTEEEINRIRESCRLLAQTHRKLAEMVEEGITTLELDRFARDYIERHGGKPAFLNYMGYPASLCTSVNDVVIHGIPDNRKLRNGDIISLDLGIDLKGYFSDAAQTLAVGDVPAGVKELINVTRECLYAGIDQARVGNRIHDIGRAVYDHATAHGFGVVKDYCGHGVGFSQHEDPQIPNYVSRGSNPRIKAGMVLAIEPMINQGTGRVKLLDDDWTVKTMDGMISAHWEHTVAVFRDHTEILTDSEQSF
ncbi:MAG: type I methionyl aminopeptidase [Spirochaetota bacterium]|nr:type I methionyl aminopeptidase [Spirochaetota bacterium]